METFPSFMLQFNNKVQYSILWFDKAMLMLWLGLVKDHVLI